MYCTYIKTAQRLMDRQEERGTGVVVRVVTLPLGSK